MLCDNIYSITNAIFEIKKSLFGKKPKFDRTLTLIAASSDIKSLHLQCISVESRDVWMKAFNALLVFRHQSKLELK